MIKLWFTDFWHEDTENVIVNDNPLFNILYRHFDIRLSREKPDFLIYSCFGSKFLKYRCPRIFYTGENLSPDPAECDYSFSFDPTENHNFRLPNYALNHLDGLLRPRNVDDYLSAKEKFCNFIYSNPCCAERNLFYVMLSKYKNIDSLGKIFNNVTGLGSRSAHDYESEKISSLRPYKFTIAFENASYPGYTTEKIAHAFIAGSIPIYWGNPDIAHEFNPNAFINCHDFDNFNDVIKYIIEVDNNNELYRKYLESMPFINDKFVATLTESAVVKNFENIFYGDIFPPVGASTYNRLLRLAPEAVTKKILRRRRKVKHRQGKLWRECSKAYKRGNLWNYTKSLTESKIMI